MAQWRVARQQPLEVNSEVKGGDARAQAESDAVRDACDYNEDPTMPEASICNSCML